MDCMIIIKLGAIYLLREALNCVLKNKLRPLFSLLFFKITHITAHIQPVYKSISITKKQKIKYVKYLIIMLLMNYNYLRILQISVDHTNSKS